MTTDPTHSPEGKPGAIAEGAPAVVGYIITSHYNRQLWHLHSGIKTEEAAVATARLREEEGHTDIRVWKYPEMTEVTRPEPEYLVHCVNEDDWLTLSPPGLLEQCSDDEVFVREPNGDFRKLTPEEVEAL